MSDRFVTPWDPRPETAGTVLATDVGFPEGPVWLADGSLAFTDIRGGRVARVAPDGTVHTIAHVGGGPNGLAIGPDGAFYVCNNGGFLWHPPGGPRRSVAGTPPGYRGGSVQRVDAVTGEVRTLYERCGDVRLLGPNDLVFDANGGFYFTDMGRTRSHDRDIGSVYYAQPDGSAIQAVIHPIMQPNGIGLSPDGRTLYVAETETSRLWAFRIVEPGVVESLPFPSPNGGRLVCGLPGYQRFDSLALEEGGNICIATLTAGCITVVAPTGEVLRQVVMPDLGTTNLCFGGPDMRTAWITLSYAPAIVRLDWPEAGLRLNFNA
jgi:gluconolactonase